MAKQIYDEKWHFTEDGKRLSESVRSIGDAVTKCLANAVTCDDYAFNDVKCLIIDEVKYALDDYFIKHGLAVRKELRKQEQNK